MIENGQGQVKFTQHDIMIVSWHNFLDIQERPATLAKGERSSRSWWPAQRRATQSRRAQGRERQEELFFSGKGDFGPLSKNG